MENKNAKIINNLMIVTIVLCIVNIINGILNKSALNQAINDMINTFKDLNVTMTPEMEQTMHNSATISYSITLVSNFFPLFCYALMYIRYFKQEKITKRTTKIFFGFGIYFMIASLGSGIFQLSLTAILIAIVVLLNNLRKEFN
jgi:hypothetical protein